MPLIIHVRWYDTYETYFFMNEFMKEAIIHCGISWVYEWEEGGYVLDRIKHLLFRFYHISMLKIKIWKRF